MNAVSAENMSHGRRHEMGQRAKTLGPLAIASIAGRLLILPKLRRWSVPAIYIPNQASNSGD